MALTSDIDELIVTAKYAGFTAEQSALYKRGIDHRLEEKPLESITCPFPLSCFMRAGWVDADNIIK
jgi:hypothetical protein